VVRWVRARGRGSLATFALPLSVLPDISPRKTRREPLPSAVPLIAAWTIFPNAEAPLFLFTGRGQG